MTAFVAAAEAAAAGPVAGWARAARGDEPDAGALPAGVVAVGTAGGAGDEPAVGGPDWTVGAAGDPVAAGGVPDGAVPVGGAPVGVVPVEAEPGLATTGAPGGGGAAGTAALGAGVGAGAPPGVVGVGVPGVGVPGGGAGGTDARDDWAATADAADWAAGPGTTVACTIRPTASGTVGAGAVVPVVTAGWVAAWVGTPPVPAVGAPRTVSWTIGGWVPGLRISTVTGVPGLSSCAT
ncbi:hypothetical protein [Thalassobaculum fulvum]|uniref:hypothetical protein n=1 Tax=Thalassobaculum fulvum TaxID=1633335 RepID=UPI0016751A1C|nr:hypothetical protein [Thalassobaculum fulvum]